jgi:putative membrane protein
MKRVGKMILMLGISGITTGAVADESMTATNQKPTMLTPQQFVEEAIAGGLKEVRLGEIALGRSENPDVKRFAKHMVNDHSKANEKLMKIAADEGLSLPSTNMFSADDPNWSSPLITNPSGLKGSQLLKLKNLPNLADYQAIQRLQTLSGDPFDQSYAAEMVNDHTNALNLFTEASQNLSDKKLSKFADHTLPTLRKHYGMAAELDGKLSGSTNTNMSSSANTDGAGSHITTPMGAPSPY